MDDNGGGSTEVYTQQTGSHLSPFDTWTNNSDSSTLSNNRSPATLRRRDHALLIKKYLHGVKSNNTIEEKAYISSDGCPAPLLWREDLYGIPRIAVHGKNSICVVVRREDVSSLRHQVFQVFKKEDPKELKLMGNQFWEEWFNIKFGNTVIYEAEEHAGLYLESLKKARSRRGKKKPFSIVSSNLGSTVVVCDKASGHEASSAEYDVDSAIKFLQEAMNSGRTFTFTETVMTANSALEHMFGKKFKLDEIQVFVLKKEKIGRKKKRERTSCVQKTSCEYCMSILKKKLYEFEAEEFPSVLFGPSPKKSIWDF